MTEPLTIIDAQSKRLVRRRLLCAAIVVAGVACTVFWIRRPDIDPKLIGRWEWSPDPKAGFPMQLDGDGSARVTITIGCCSFARSCTWTVNGDELRLYSTPQLDNLTIDGARTYVSDLWKAHTTSQPPVRRYQIVERTEAKLRLQPLWSDGSVSDSPIEVYQRAVENPLVSNFGLLRPGSIERHERAGSNR